MLILPTSETEYWIVTATGENGETQPGAVTYVQDGLEVVTSAGKAQFMAAVAQNATAAALLAALKTSGTDSMKEMAREADAEVKPSAPAPALRGEAVAMSAGSDVIVGVPDAASKLILALVQARDVAQVRLDDAVTMARLMIGAPAAWEVRVKDGAVFFADPGAPAKQ